MTTPEVYGLGVGAGVGLGLSILLLCCLKCLGFGSRGVRSDSYAALRHSNIGDVERGSCFACCQSFGALCSTQCGCVFMSTIIGGVIGLIMGATL